MRRVLITGGSGYMGSRLVQHFTANGVAVTALLRPSSETGALAALGTNLRLKTYDGSLASIRQAIDEGKPDIVFHLAAHTVGHNEPDSIPELVRANIEFGTQLLEAMKTENVRRFVNTGTPWQHFASERSMKSDTCLYAATKSAFAQILRFYMDAHGFLSINLLPADVYGPADQRPKLFRVLRQAAATSQPLLMSPGNQTLDLIHIDDVTAAFAHAGRMLWNGDAGRDDCDYSVRSGEHHTLREIVDIFARALGRAVPVVWGARPHRTREMMMPWSGPLLPGWRATITLEDGIKQMLAVDGGI